VIIDKKGKEIGAKYDGIAWVDNEFCAKQDCYEIIYSGEYCDEHDTTTSVPYCDAYGCLNKAYAGDYCLDHNHLE